jgi:hypothetical protein
MREQRRMSAREGRCVVGEIFKAMSDTSCNTITGAIPSERLKSHE